MIHVLIQRFAAMFLAAALFICIPPTAHANKTLKILRKEYKEFVKKEVLPTKKEWKGQFDKSLSASDLTKLNTLRAKASDLLDKIKAEKKKINKMDKSDKAARKTIKNIIKGYKSQLDEIRKQLIPIIKNNQAGINTLKASAKKIKPVWNKKVDKMVAKWKREYPGAFKPKKLKKVIKKMKDFDINYSTF